MQFGIMCNIRHGCFFIFGNMVTTTQIRRYAWVVELLQRRRHLTLGQIKNEWVRSALAEYADEKLDRKTWYKCFDDISMIYGKPSVNPVL